MGGSYAIIGDVNCDLGAEARERYGVDGYTRGHITLPGGEEVASSLEWDRFGAREFYASLKSRKSEYKTSPSGAGEIAEYLETFLKAGRDVLAVSISKKLSATYNLMLNARELLRERYPEREIHIVDSMKYSAAQGLLILKACELRDAGLGIAENAARLTEIRSTIHQMGLMDDLFFVASKGRISHSKAFMGTLVGVKPMGDFDSDGMVTVLGKAKGYDKAYRAIAAYIVRTIVEPQAQTILIAQTARETQAEALIGHIRDAVRPKGIERTDVYPVSGINVGPGMIAAYYFGTPITDLAFERGVMASVLEGA